MWISIVDFKSTTGISATGEESVPYTIKFSCPSSPSLSSRNKKLIRCIKGFLNFQNNLMICIPPTTVGISEKVSFSLFKSKSVDIFTKHLFINVAEAFPSEMKTSFLEFRPLLLTNGLIVFHISCYMSNFLYSVFESNPF